MNVIYSAKKEDFSSSEEFIFHTLSVACGDTAFELKRTKIGKPYLENSPIFLSLSHTDKKYFLALSDFEIGLDAEEENRLVDTVSVSKKYFQGEIFTDNTSFLKRWTACESAIKLFGGTIAKDLKRLIFHEEYSLLEGDQTPIYYRHFSFDGHILCVSLFEKDFPPFHFIALS